MKNIINPSFYNNLSYQFAQAALYKITPAVASISFKIQSETEVQLQILLFSDYKSKEEELVFKFVDDIKTKLPDIELKPTIQNITKEDFSSMNFSTLECMFHLKNNEYIN